MQREILRNYPRQLKRAAAQGLIEGAPERRPTRKFEWAVLFFAGVRLRLPGSLKRPQVYESLFYDTRKLPFDPAQYEFGGKIDDGGVNDVYLIRSKTEGPSWVLKVNYFAKRGRTDTIAREAAAIKAEYKEVKKVYGAIPDFILPEYCFTAAFSRRRSRCF